MTDENALVRAWLLQTPSITTLLQKDGDNVPAVFCVDLPEKFDPSSGPGIVVGTRGGLGNPEVPAILNPSVQIRVWADKEENALARQVYGAVYDLMQGATNIDLGNSGYVLSSVEEVHGQDLSDPDEGWATVRSFFRLMVR